MSAAGRGGYLFVYGSLRRSMPAAARPPSGSAAFDMLTRYAEPMGDGDVQGRLYAVSWYPGLTAAKARDERVAGEVWRIGDRRLFTALDAYEGHDYVRVRRTVRMKDQMRILAWVYAYTAAVGRAPRIETGDYVSWLELHTA